MITPAPRASKSRIVGRLARIRPSSVMTPLSKGTFISARTRTVWPRTSRSSARLISAEIPFLRKNRRGEGGQRSPQPRADQDDEVGQPVRVAELVVVPADDLDLVTVGHGERGIENARPGGADDVGGHDRVGGVTQVILERPLG